MRNTNLKAILRAAVVSCLAIAIAVGLLSNADAGLFVRVTSYDAGNIILDQEGASIADPTPDPAANINFSTFSLQGFSLVVSNNAATTGGDETNHGLTINITKNTTGADALAVRLVVEFLGDFYVEPGAGVAVNTLSGTVTSQNLNIGSISVDSGVSNSNAALPGTVGDTTGLAGLVSVSGSILAPGAASLVPNTDTSPIYAISNPFSSYQVFDLSGFTPTSGTSGSATLGATARVIGPGNADFPTPEPASMVAWAAFAGLGAAFGYRRNRRKS